MRGEKIRPKTILATPGGPKQQRKRKKTTYQQTSRTLARIIERSQNWHKRAQTQASHDSTLNRHQLANPGVGVCLENDDPPRTRFWKRSNSSELPWCGCLATRRHQAQPPRGSRNGLRCGCHRDHETLTWLIKEGQTN